MALFFDSKASVLNLETDVCYQNYINETALFLEIRNTNDNFFYVSAIEDSKLKGNRTDVGFIPFEAYSELVKNKDLVERIFDWITINFDCVESVVASLEYKGGNESVIVYFQYSHMVCACIQLCNCSICSENRLFSSG